MYRYKITLWMFFTLLTLLTMGQKQVQIKGTVFNSVTMEPIEGARVTSEGAKKAVLTDKDGNFLLRPGEKDLVIDVQGDGFWRREVSLFGRQMMLIYLTPVSVRGYAPVYNLPEGSRKREDKTGSSRMLRTEDASRGALFADELLPGVFPGLMVQTKSGMPGEGSFVGMQGMRSMQGNNTPLIIIDGLPVLPDQNLSATYTGYSRNIFNPVMVKDLALVTWVKGYDALSYGTMGANGVLLLETEKASDMETKVEFETVNGVSMINSRVPLLGVEEFNKYFFDIGQTRYSSTEFLEKYPFMADRTSWPLYNNETNWMKEIYAPAFSTENILKVKGGDAIAKYALTAGYMTQKGVVKNTDLSKYYVRINANMEVTRQLSMFVNTGFSYYQKNIAEQGMVRQTNPMLAAFHKPAMLGPWLKDEGGNPYNVFDRVREFGVSNPSALVEQVAPESNTLDLILNVGLSSWLTSDLNLSGSFGMFYNYNREDLFIPGVTYGTIAPLEDGKARNTVRNNKSILVDYYGTISLKYGKQFENHRLDAILEGKMLFGNNKLEYVKGINTPTDFDRKLSSVGSADGKLLEAYDDNSRWMNLFGSVRYNYNRQLYLGVAASMDGSSVSGENAPVVQVYPAVNIAWKMNNSSFLRDIDWLDDLTIRGEFVAGGNSRFPAMTGKYYYESYVYNSLVGLVRGNIPNLNLHPEKVATLGVGVDFATHGNRVGMSVDIFEERTTDMLVESLLSEAYGTKFRHENGGEMRTRGMEVALNVIPVSTKDFTWTLGITFATSASELKSLGKRQEFVTSLTDDATLISRVGESPYAFYGYEADGILNSDAEAKEAGLIDYKGNAFQAGDIRFRSLDGNNIIDENDRTVLGDAMPDFFGGIFTSFGYKMVTLSAQFTYSYGNEIYNAVRRSGESMKDFTNQTGAVENRWVYDNQQTEMPRAVYGDPAGNSRFSSRWIEDGSYLKLKNLTLNYEYPGKLWVFSKFRTYFTAENLFTLTKYLGEDPEFAYSYDYKFLGVDYGKVPLGKTFRLGLCFNF